VIQTVNDAMLELQGALIARSLYPYRHPHIRASERRAHALLGQALAQRDEVTVFALGERVVFNEDVLPASQTLSRSLFHQIRENGADRITFGRGLEEDELRKLLDRLAFAEEEERPPLIAGGHIRFGFIQEAGDVSEGVVLGLPVPAEMATNLQEVWTGIERENQLDRDALGDIVSSVSKAVADSVGVMLPLAALKRHDEYTFVHTVNVAILSTSLAEAMGFNGNALHEVNMAALLHDIGKKKVSETLLNKNGRFTEDESRLMQKHPAVGARMLFNMPGVPDIAPVVAFEHHIRADRSGYPRVPKGWKLNLASRIVQIADVFDALRSHRPYRSALPMNKILRIMQGDVGTFFDGDLLAAFFQKVVSRGVPDPAPFAADCPNPSLP